MRREDLTESFDTLQVLLIRSFDVDVAAVYVDAACVCSAIDCTAITALKVLLDWYYDNKTIVNCCWYVGLSNWCSKA